MFSVFTISFYLSTTVGEKLMLGGNVLEGEGKGKMYTLRNWMMLGNAGDYIYIFIPADGRKPRCFAKCRLISPKLWLLCGRVHDMNMTLF